MPKQRFAGLDIIRSIAILFVIIIHSIAILGTMDKLTLSYSWELNVLIRYTALSCVPLFLLLSGYLQCGKKLERKFYTSLIPIILSYVAISIMDIAVQKYYLGIDISLSQSIRGLFDFTANSYAWYVEMFIGLFLLIPFLNIIWNNLKTNRQRLLLIAVLLLLTSLPSFFKSFIVMGTKLDIIPDYWEAIYPVTYYFIGAYIKLIKPKLNVFANIGLLIVSVAIPSYMCWIFTKQTGEYAWYVCNSYACITTGFTAVCIFLLFYSIKGNPFTSAILKEISVCSFEMYLFSNIVDKIVYKNLDIPMWRGILTVFAASYICARILRLLLHPLSKFSSKIYIKTVCKNQN